MGFSVVTSFGTRYKQKLSRIFLGREGVCGQ